MEKKASIIHSTQYTNLNDFLTKHSIKEATLERPITHTRIGSKPNNHEVVYGGKYCILPDELSVFYELYHKHVFVLKNPEYLTEKQLPCGPLLVDLDFRYDYNKIDERQHHFGEINDIVVLYLEILKNMLQIQPNTEIPIFVMEKPNMNRDVDKKVLKDGIHMIFGIHVDTTFQLLLREAVLKEIGGILNIPITNPWSDVLDIAVTKGSSNWQLYGSKKPDCDTYRLTHYMVAKWANSANSENSANSANSANEEYTLLYKDDEIKNMESSKQFMMLTAQYDKHVSCAMHPRIEKDYQLLKSKNNKVQLQQQTTNKNKPKTNDNDNNNDNNNNDNDNNNNTKQYIQPHLEDIRDYETLELAVNNIMDSLSKTEYEIRETHEYVQILPPMFYEPGSHLLNTKIAFGLKHTDERLFLSWVMLRSKASDFDYATIPYLYTRWTQHFNQKKGEPVIRRQTIRYLAKQHAREEYNKIFMKTADYFIEPTLCEQGSGDWDFGNVLYHMFKDDYICATITKEKKWYRYGNHKWEYDEGMRLRMAISKDLCERYYEKNMQNLMNLQNLPSTDEKHEKLTKQIKRISEICTKLKKTSDKNNIMREAMEIFFDGDFIKNMDANPYLMCFTNGVFDFRNKEFRNGRPQDYITKTTGVRYINDEEMKTEENQKIMGEICTFMKQLFPQPNLEKYMWEHLGAALIGVKKEHAFNIYVGSGSNGKSKLTELMGHAIGDYKGTMPINLLTDKRTTIGGTSSELIALKGIRYAVGQEVSKGAVLNDGVMKEISACDKIQARALFSDSETFVPQCSIVICTNTMMDVNTNDDGTWRRIKVVEYKAKFLKEGDLNTDNTKYVFPRDDHLEDKLPVWAPVFASMLVKIACEYEGVVKNCEEVTQKSNSYRQSQDHISKFMAEKIVFKEGGSIGKKLLMDVFKSWFTDEIGSGKCPKASELEDAMNKKYGQRKGKNQKWTGIELVINEDEDETDLKNEL